MTKNTVNESFPFAAMAALHAALNAVAREYEPMPDEAMDYINEAIDIVSHAIIAAPATTEAEVAHKFRHAATLIGDEGGMFVHEPAAVRAAMTALRELRFREHIENYGWPVSG
ncbi:hypothetical protein [Shinella zoogloeoides]|uniref:hypothetical protein n=1 Tax=Shinella zoogloeoides TaxID=352475 RepID=UPI0013C31E68|nr:hypothetical protein [Shinella zoogloeoides]